MDEKKIFDEYGNYNFPTEKEQEGLNTIVEMAKIIDIDCGECYTCDYYDKYDKGLPANCTCFLQAKELYNAGYRKESDTARGILTELKNTRFHKGTLTYDFEMALNKIAEKYGVDWEGENDP